MKKEEHLTYFQKIVSQLNGLNYASAIMFWDASTDAPKSGMDARSEAIGVLSGIYHNRFMTPQFKTSMDVLSEYKDTLTDVEKALLRHYQKEYDKLSKIPEEEYEAFQAHISKSAMIWEEAKANRDYDLFMPYLEKNIETLKKFAEYRGYTGHPYNLYIDDFEPGMTVDQLDQFFETLKRRLIPLLKAIKLKSVPETKMFHKNYPKHMQQSICNQLLDTIGFDRERGLFKESVHPFTMGVDIDDVRLTTHYYENNLMMSMLSTVHEGGHGIYEQNIRKSLAGTPLATGASNALHESQSRIYENNFFKSEAFLSYLWPILQDTYRDQLDVVSFNAFNHAVNCVKPSLIRTEADELTYSLHILIRYELELGLISGTESVAELPKAWYDKMEQYLGVVPTHDGEGVLQDVHWSEALFGYFPTYALGSAYAAQIYHYMKKDIAVDESLKKGDFSEITQWLNEHIHQYGAIYEPMELIEKVTGEQLNAEYYCDYLEQKYKKLYHL